MDDFSNPALIDTLLGSQKQFLAFLSRRLPSQAIAEDLLQQSLVRAIRQIEQFEDRERVTAWFYRILRNALIDYYRSRASDDRKSKAWLEELVAAGEEFIRAPDEIRDGVCACLSRLLPTLKPEYGEILQKVDLDGTELSVAASELGLTQNNATVRLHRARQALKKSLQLCCGSCSEHGCLECSCSHD